MARDHGIEMEMKQWKDLANEVYEKRCGQKNSQEGSITIIGSGILSVGHFTLQSIGYMKTADSVFYCVADHVTKIYIKDIRPEAMDLAVLYDDCKDRYKTYVQMSEILLNEARKGRNVVGIFYGHPGVFVHPSHRAIKLAKAEGIKAKMLAAPSAEDCLFADLGIDPSMPGCQSFEATDLLIHSRNISKELHVIIWQVGCVGDMDFRSNGFTNDKLHILVEYLEKVYGPDHKIIHYKGPQYPVCDPVKDVVKIHDICSPGILRTVSSISTFYIPPKDTKAIDQEMCKRLGIEGGFKLHSMRHDGYTELENEALWELGSWKTPSHMQLPFPSQLSDYLIKKAINPTTVLPKDMSALHHNAIRRKEPKLLKILTSTISKNTNIPDAFRVAEGLFTDIVFAIQYLHSLTTEQDPKQAATVTYKWLHDHGFQSNPAEVQKAMKTMMHNSLLPWSNTYHSTDGATLLVDGLSNPPTVKFGYENIKKFKFANGVLTWNSGDGNSTNGEVHFPAGALPATTDFTLKEMLSLEMSGRVWNKRRGNEQIFDSFLTPRGSINLSKYQGRYEIQIGKKKHTLDVEGSNANPSIKFDDKQVDCTFDLFALKWSKQNDNESAELYFLDNQGNDNKKTVMGKIWKSSDKPKFDNVIGLHVHGALVQPSNGKAKVDEQYPTTVGVAINIMQLVDSGTVTVANSSEKSLAHRFHKCAATIGSTMNIAENIVYLRTSSDDPSIGDTVVVVVIL